MMHYTGLPCLCSSLYTKSFVILNKLLLLDIDFTMSNLYIVTLTATLFHELDNRGLQTMYYKLGDAIAEIMIKRMMFIKWFWNNCH